MAVACEFHPASAPDYLPAGQLRALQLHRLRDMVGRAYHRAGVNDPNGRNLYRERMDASGASPDDLRALDDIRRLPFTTKADLRDSYPYGTFAVPLGEVVRLHASSGTTGKPIVVGYTREDLDVWSEVMLRSLAAAGVHAGDIVHVAYGYGLFTGGLGAHQGAEALGCAVVPVSVGNTERQVMVMRDFGVTVICCTPSYFLHLAEKARERGVDLGRLPLRIGIFGAEPWTEGMRGRIESESALKAHDIYGLSEIIGPGVAMECREQAGQHVFEDHFYPEIIDPDTGEVLPDGSEGELVLTTLSKRAQPMIRYRTRDITALMPEPCACGRTIRRLLRIGRRSDDMLIIRGVNVFPSQIETALLSVEGAAPHFEIILTREHDLDRMEIRVEYTAEMFAAGEGDAVRGIERLRKDIEHSVESVTGIRAAVRLVEPRTLARSEGKARRVIDRRQL